jgi:hypothetical protein
LTVNPYLRKKKIDYHPNDRDQIRRSDLRKRSCQPIDHDFLKTQYRKICRHFNPAWFKEYVDWLKYNILEDYAYCPYYFLFRPDTKHQVGGDSFVTES